MLLKKYLLKKIRNTSLSSESFLKMQIIERKFQNMLKEIFTSVPKYSILHKKGKNKQSKYDTADQVVVMQVVNFVLMKYN